MNIAILSVRESSFTSESDVKDDPSIEKVKVKVFCVIDITFYTNYFRAFMCVHLLYLTVLF